MAELTELYSSNYGFDFIQSEAAAAARTKLDIDPFEFYQAIASSQWDWTHNLGGYPEIDIMDESRNAIMADYQHLSVNQVRVTHLSSQTGYIRARR